MVGVARRAVHAALRLIAQPLSSRDESPSILFLMELYSMRNMMFSLTACTLLCAAAYAGDAARGAAAAVDSTRLDHADQDAGNWLTYGRTYSEQRYSPLTRITADNVTHVGLTWFADLDRQGTRGNAYRDRWRDVRFDRLEHGQGL